MNNLLWITYAWVDNEQGNFDFLVQKLGQSGIATSFDRITLIPGRRLWTQIADRISSSELAGWAYLLTPNSINSTACQEEMSYALQRALETKGSGFPLIGLMHQINIRDVPLPLRVRLCVNLAEPDWIEEIRAGLIGKPPNRVKTERDEFFCQAHYDYLGKKGHFALEVGTRFAELKYWRIAVPLDGPPIISWGTGPRNAGGLSSFQHDAVSGEYPDIGGVPMAFVGSGDSITPAISAYVIFDGALPKKFFFGTTTEPFSTEVKGKILLVK